MTRPIDDMKTNDGFHTTQWTSVMAAKGSSPEAKAALDLLCETYYAPVLNFIKRHDLTAYGVENAEDICHDFFIRVLQGEEFKHLERGPGRFRSYLFGAVRFFLGRLRREQVAAKRGGNEKHVPFDPDLHHYEREEPHDAQFDHDWAATIVSKAITELCRDAENRDQVDQFKVLRRWLLGAPSEENREEAAASLGVTKEHFKVLLSRVRKKFREHVRQQIARTVENESDIDHELSYLISALS